MSLNRKGIPERYDFKPAFPPARACSAMESVWNHKEVKLLLGPHLDTTQISLFSRLSSIPNQRSPHEGCEFYGICTRMFLKYRPRISKYLSSRESLEFSRGSIPIFCKLTLLLISRFEKATSRATAVTAGKPNESAPRKNPC